MNMPLGKHKDRPLGEIPSDYLDWLTRTVKLSAGLRTAVAEELARRGHAPPAQTRVPGPGPAACRHCRAAPLAVTWHEQHGGRRAIRADCRRCGRFNAFLPQTPANVASANARTSPTGLLDVLVRCQGEGVELVERFGDVVLVPPGRASAELQSLVRQHQHQLRRHLIVRP
jgi:hypothetical protein